MDADSHYDLRLHVVHTFYVLAQAEHGQLASTAASVLVHNACGDELTPGDLTNKSADELRQFAQDRGYEPFGQQDPEGNYRKFRDPVTRQERLRIDQGNVDPTTGEPYNDPRAAVPHAHGYDPNGNPIVDPESGNKHVPLNPGD